MNILAAKSGKMSQVAPEGPLYTEERQDERE